jgi:leucyl-tRNA synthetase
VGVQVNGKTRGTVVVAATATQEDVHAQANKDEKLQKHIAGKTIAKAIYVPGRILNLIIK